MTGLGKVSGDLVTTVEQATTFSSGMATAQNKDPEITEEVM